MPKYLLVTLINFPIISDEIAAFFMRQVLRLVKDETTLELERAQVRSRRPGP